MFVWKLFIRRDGLVNLDKWRIFKNLFSVCVIVCTCLTVYMFAETPALCLFSKFTAIFTLRYQTSPQERENSPSESPDVTRSSPST